MNGTEILVTGGTGVLGSKAAERLSCKGIEPRILSRGDRPGTVRGNLLTGEGLEVAVRGVDTIVHCASSPFRKPRRTDVGGTERLLEIASKAGVSHVVFVSIVGIDRVQSYPYYRVKLGTECLVEGSPIPHTILRATQFYDLVLMTVRALTRLPVVPVPKGLVGQPIDAGEVADRLVEFALSGPAGRVTDVGGPEVGTVDDTVRTYLELKRMRKKFLEFPLPGRTARDEDRLFGELRGCFDEAQLVELTAAIAWENHRARFNHALGMGYGGLSKGSYCLLAGDSEEGRMEVHE